MINYFLVGLSLILLGFSYNGVAGSCLNAHVSMVTPTGRMPDREGITLTIGTDKSQKSSNGESTDPYGNVCVPYNSLKEGDKIKLIIGNPTDDSDSNLPTWSAWKILAPYHGITYLPKVGSDYTPIEIIIVPPTLETSLMRFQDNTYISQSQESHLKASQCRSHNSPSIQIIALENKDRANLLINTLAPKYQACIQDIITNKGKSLYRVNVFLKTGDSLEHICGDIKKNYLSDSNFTCKVSG
jgi:hypothetical protein